MTSDGRPVEVEQVASTYSVPDGERVEDEVRIPIDAFGVDLPEALEALTDSTFDVACHPYDWP